MITYYYYSILLQLDKNKPPHIAPNIIGTHMGNFPFKELINANGGHEHCAVLSWQEVKPAEVENIWGAEALALITANALYSPEALDKQPEAVQAKEKENT